jgi:phosphoglycerol transferase MdoB-like AlkP superfamily enzyme
MPVSRRRRWLEFYAALGVTLFLSLTINSNETRFSQERVLNEIANNGQRAFLNSALSRHLDFAGFYKTMPAGEAFGRTQRLLSDGTAQFVSPSDSLERSVLGNAARPRLNVVILLEESLGSEFWGCLGRSNSLTPEMDRLAASEGMLFTNLYASGNRTVRGFEGVLSSFPPLPGDSIVKRDQSQNVETIARILKRDGYQTVFLYGGRGLFDGMRSFALNNGYDRFIEQKDFPEARRSDYTKTIWGACDEIIFGRAIEEFRKLNDSGKPFLATILSVSNHKPYVYPRGRIPEDPDKPTRMREKAVKYSDWCLGKFFTEARKESFWTNTIFVVVADHGARVYGSQSIPIHSYEIPLLLVSPAVVKSPSRVPHLGCSLDVAPTILGLLGRPYETLFFGRDLLNCAPSEGRVLLNHNRDIGLFRQDRLVVLGINKTVEYYHGNPKAEGLQRIAHPEPADLELEKDAMALYQMADVLYTSRRYAVRQTAPGKLNASK